jgi:hypothetical protein
VEALRTEQRVKRELAARVTELEAAAEVMDAEEPASPPASTAAAAAVAESPSILRPPSPDEELTRLLAEERQRTADLQKVRHGCWSSPAYTSDTTDVWHSCIVCAIALAAVVAVMRTWEPWMFASGTAARAVC